MGISEVYFGFSAAVNMRGDRETKRLLGEERRTEMAGGLGARIFCALCISAIEIGARKVPFQGNLGLTGTVNRFPARIRLIYITKASEV